MLRVIELRKELFVFLNEHNSALAQSLCDDVRKAKLAYLADVFNVLSGLNASMQDLDNNILKTHDKIDAFRKKLRLWKARCQDGVFDMFPLLSCVVDETIMKTNTAIKTISNRMQNLSIATTTNILAMTISPTLIEYEICLNASWLIKNRP
jgi:hypothetical protein